MATFTVAEAKSRFSDLLRRAEYGGERVVVRRHGKPVAAIVSTADLERLEALEDATDVADAAKALQEAERAGTLPLAAVLKKFGLEHLLGTGATPARPGAATLPRPRRRTASPSRARRSTTSRRG